MFLIQLSPIWLCFLLAYVLFRHLAAQNRIHSSRCIALGFATLLTGTLFPAIAECASACNQLTGIFVAAAWMAVSVVLLLILMRLKLNPKGIIQLLISEKRKLAAQFKSQSPLTQGVFAVGIILLVALGLVAAAFPTTIWDCQTYHMPRIMHWIQNKNLHHYASNNLRQIQFAPGGELQIATTIILCGNDQAANLPQWWAMVMDSLLVIFLTYELIKLYPVGKKEILHEPKIAGLCAACAFVLAITIPSVVGQGVTTQNDLLSQTWVVLMVVMVYLLVQNPRNLFYIIGVAGAFALAVNAKVTNLLYAPPWLLAAGLFFLKKRYYPSIVKLGVAGVVLTLAINAPWMKRNYDLFQHPLAAKSEFYQYYANTQFSPAQVCADLFRAISIYTRTPSQDVTDALNKILVNASSVTGISLADPAFLFGNCKFYLQPKSVIGNGDGLGSFLPVMVFVSLLAIFVVRFRWISICSLHLILILAGFVLFTAYLRWNPWMERFYMFFFLMAAPVAGMVLGTVGRRFLLIPFCAFLSLNAVLLTSYNPGLPIVGTDFHFNPYYHPLKEIPFVRQPREQQYYAFRPEFYSQTVAMSQDLMSAGVTNVLLKTGSDSWEYPFWTILQSLNFRGTIHHVMVDNETAPAADTNWPSAGSALVTIDVNLDPPPKDYQLAVTYGQNAIYFKAPTPERRVRLIDNQLQLGFRIQSQGRLRIRCRPVDAKGNAVTNTVIRLMTQNYWHDFLTTGEVIELTCPVEPGNVPVGIACPGEEDRHLTLSNFEHNFEVK